MFKKLKRKFILTSLLTSTLVLAIAFSSIYFVAENASRHREMMLYAPENSEQISTQPQQAQQEIQQQTQQEVQQQTQQETPPAKPEAANQTEDEASRFNKFLNERIRAERNDSLSTLLISLLVAGAAVEIAVLFISIYLAEQSIRPVREAYNAQKEFIANASHEIKTPLAVIQANLEAADIKGNKWLDNVAKKTEDLANLNNQLLALARSESVSEETKQTETDLNKLIDGIISAFEPKAEEKGIALTKSSNIKDRVKLNKQALEQILNIYTDNGIKYGKACVSFNIKKDRIFVISDGKPMDEKKIPHLFDRFYQTDKTSEGVGLGLAIAKSIADKNGWKVSAYVDKEFKTNVFVLQFK